MSTEPAAAQTLSDAATKEILGDNLSFLVAYGKDGQVIPFTPSGRTMTTATFPVPYEPQAIDAVHTTTAIKAQGKCTIIIGGIIYCYTC